MADSGYPKQNEQIDATDLNNIFSATVTSKGSNPYIVRLSRRSDAENTGSVDLISYYINPLPSSPADDIMLNFGAFNSKVSAYAKNGHKHSITEIAILKNWVPSGNNLIFGGS